MKKIFVPVLFFVFCSSALAQRVFDLKDASKYFDVKVSVAQCDESSCTGAVKFQFFKKGGSTPYQIITLKDTYVQLEEGAPLANITMLYDKQSVVNIGDFNFDGMEDVALCNGNNGSYGGPSYSVYLSSRKAAKFVYNAAFSEIASHLGFFQVDTKAKTLTTFDKSGCCWHIVEKYDVMNGKPRKIFEEVEDATIPDETKVKITIKKLVNGKWQTKSKFVKREE